jgi:hypothetical protein
VSINVTLYGGRRAYPSEYQPKPLPKLRELTLIKRETRSETFSDGLVILQCAIPTQLGKLHLGEIDLRGHAGLALQLHLEAFTHVEDLALHIVAGQDGAAEEGLPRVLNPLGHRLTRLKVTGVAVSLKLVQRLKLPMMRHLDVPLRADKPDFLATLHQSMPSLEHLHLLSLDAPNALFLAHFVHLHSLILHGNETTSCSMSDDELVHTLVQSPHLNMLLFEDFSSQQLLESSTHVPDCVRSPSTRRAAPPRRFSHGLHSTSPSLLSHHHRHRHSFSDSISSSSPASLTGPLLGDEDGNVETYLR